MEIDALIPVRQCEHKINDGVVVLIFDKLKKTILDKFFKNKNRRIAKIDLDEIGSFVWLQCDGKRNVSEIIKLTKEEFGEKEEKIEERAKLFINQLAQKRFIRFYTIK